MPSFDVVSEVNLHEVTNAVDQANREVGTRFDFKGSGAIFEQAENIVTLRAQNDFQLKQMLEILKDKFARRGVDLACLEVNKQEISGKEAQQKVQLQQGIDATLAKAIIKLVKDSKLKVQTSIMGEKIRITGKKRDDLQQVMSLLRQSKFELPLQFNNLRD